MDNRQTQLEKIRALLAKAESTEYPEEAKAFFDGAQRLMTTYAIEEAELRKEGHGDQRPVVVTLRVEKPYANAKTMLLAVVAKNMNCRVTVPHSSQRKGKDAWTAHLYGFPNRVTDSEMMFTSLLVQCTGEMMAVKKPDGIHGKTWYNNFIIGFATEVRDRLYRAKKEAESLSTVGNALVLIRDEMAAVDALVGKTSKGGSNQARYNAAANAAGREAGSRANLGRGSVGGVVRAIG